MKKSWFNKTKQKSKNVKSKKKTIKALLFYFCYYNY